jgi:uncharacterized membrane protein
VAVEEWALIAGVVFAGLWSGLYCMLCLVMHPMLRAMEGRDFALFLRAFLPTARKAPFNYACVVIIVVAPIVALFAFDDSGSTPFYLTAAGFLIALIGAFGVSNRVAEPNYDVMLAWDPDDLPAGWEVIRRKYFAINWVRAVSTWTAFGLFLAALLETV